jgi:starch-binding outer membrane protein, SusD/RagB family
MKRYLNIIKYFIILLIIIGLGSCKEYLDEAPEATVSSTDAFVNFINFQGFTEELYSCVPDYTSTTWGDSWLMGDEAINSVGGSWTDDHFDKGDYWGWMSWVTSWLYTGSVNTEMGGFPPTKGLWNNAWYGIRKANLGLENLDKLTGTDEEKNLIKGQLLFFRAWFHFELMTYFGGLPYINHELSSSEKLEFPRLNYQQTADSVAKDLRVAADLLPVDWDKTITGEATSGKNQLRITKITALAYLGKDYLYAGSPLMNKESTGKATYNTDYCKKAAAAFAEMLKYVDSGESFHHLVTFDKYSSLFYSNGSNITPGYPEAIFMSEVYNAGFNGCPWGPSNIFTPASIGAGYVSPNARYVENYGMANGLPIDDPESGYNPQDPWSNRDPRFYNDIVIDGDQVIKGSAPADKEQYRYAALYTGGACRSETQCSRTGYLLRKFIPMTCNDIDGYPNWWAGNNYMHLAYMRLSDVYLMYAEAALQGYGSATSTGSGYITPEAALNIIRSRCGAGNVASKYVADKDKFMNELIRERAIELSFEADIRYNDLRRWMLWSNKKYLEKTAIDFDRGTTMGQNGKPEPINMTERVILTRVFTDRAYWLPLPTNDVYLYPSFGQNPGW